MFLILKLTQDFFDDQHFIIHHIANTPQLKLVAYF